MSDVSPVTAQSRRQHVRRHIDLGTDTLIPRLEFAEEILGVNDRTAKRMGLPTRYVGGFAYVLRNASLKIIAEREVRHPNEPPVQRNEPPKRRRPSHR